MAKLTMEDQPEYAVLPIDSIVLLKIDSVEVVDATGRNGTTWQKLNFTFKILDVVAIGDGSPKDDYSEVITSKIWGSVPYKLTNSPENRLRQWVEAIYGMQLAVGFELDTDLLLNKQVRAVTSQYTTKAGYLRHQVESLLPYGSAPVGAAPAQAPSPSFTQPTPVSSGFHYEDEPPF